MMKNEEKIVFYILNFICLFIYLLNSVMILKNNLKSAQPVTTHNRGSGIVGVGGAGEGGGWGMGSKAITPNQRQQWK